jgi:hypothetical protein
MLPDLQVIPQLKESAYVTAKGTPSGHRLIATFLGSFDFEVTEIVHE